jgi:hypothetical protein
MSDAGQTDISSTSTATTAASSAPMADGAARSMPDLIRDDGAGAAPPADAVAASTATATATDPAAEQDGEKGAKASEEDRRFSKAFATLARQEKALREREGTYKQQLAEREQRIAHLEQIEQGLLSGNPIDALAKLGLDFNELSKRALNGGKPSPEFALTEQEKRLRALEEDREKERAAASEREQRDATERAVAEFRGKIAGVVNGDPRFELTKLHNGIDDVYGVIDEHYERTREILDIEDAAQLVESYYEAIVEKSLSGSEKYKGKLATAPGGSTRGGQRESSTPPRTLSNQVVADTPARKQLTLTREERVAAAARAFDEAAKQ